VRQLHAVCPGKIDIPGLILELRRRLAVEKGQTVAQKAIFSVVNNRKLFHSMLRTASLAQKPLAKDGFIRHLPFFLSDMTEFRSLPAIADVPLPRQVQADRAAETEEKAAFYSGCLIDFAYPEMGEAVVKILNKAGIEVIFPEGQTCCGAPARFSGAYEVAAQNASDNINALLRAGRRVRHLGLSDLHRRAEARLHQQLREPWADRRPARARKLAAKVVDFSTLVKKLVDEGRLTFKEGSSSAR
jgi:L-lactate dehydrogenase complex protein LldF